MADTSQLTERQLEIYTFIQEMVATHNYGPTVRDIGKAFNILSPNGVMCHLRALEKKGFIVRKGRSARAIQLVDYVQPIEGLPLLGVVHAGYPTGTEEQAERLDLNGLFRTDGNFALEVKGNSMIEDHIQDGDYVVIHKQQTAQNGERVVAMVNNETTLKKFYRDQNGIRLEPCNGEMRTIQVNPEDNVQILGRLVGVVRKV
jgi:repressor LexA